MSLSEKPSPGFTMKDLLREIAGVNQDVDLGEVMTTREMMPLFGVRSQKSVRTRIRPLVVADILVKTTKEIRTMDGRLAPVPAYAVSPTATAEDLERALSGV